jgi:hypothetical protein
MYLAQQTELRYEIQATGRTKDEARRLCIEAVHDFYGERVSWIYESWEDDIRVTELKTGRKYSEWEELQ